MRINVDQINAPPPHALTRTDIKDLLAILPKEWLKFIQVIHLSTTMPSNSRFVRPVIYSAYSRRLNVCCRGLEPEQAQREILRELAMLGLSIRLSYGHKLSHQQLKEIDEIIAPFLERAKSAKAEPSFI